MKTFQVLKKAKAKAINHEPFSDILYMQVYESQGNDCLNGRTEATKHELFPQILFHTSQLRVFYQKVQCSELKMIESPDKI